MQVIDGPFRKDPDALHGDRLRPALQARAPTSPGGPTSLLEALTAGGETALTSRFESVSVAGGAVLFEEGDSADAMYVVVSGAIGISVRDRSGRVRRLARVGPPETVGELAFLADAPRSATATALRDTRLLRLSREGFMELSIAVPEVMPYLARLLARRMHDGVTGVEGNSRRPSTFAVVAISHGVEPLDIARAIAEALGPQALLLDVWPEGADEDTFHAIEQSMSNVVYLAREPQGPWGRLCARRADHVVLVAAAGAPPLVPDLGRLCGESTWTRQDLIVVQHRQAAMVQPAAPLVAALPINGLRLHARIGHGADAARVARIVTGRALGVVLSGGGARGFAQLGVLRALEEVGRPVDLVGGTSIGAIIGAGVAMGWSVAEASERVVDAFVKDSPLNDYTLPFIALTRGAKVEARLARHFGETRIEDLWLPFFCLSTNLTTAQAAVHRNGHLATALRASIAIPGLLPPVATPDGVLVDGAMMNNVPADVMADLERGPVLAIDVAGDVAFQKPDARGWRMRLLRRLAGVPASTPGIAELLLRSATVSGDAQSALARERAGTVICPPLAGVDLRAWHSYRQVAEIGYQHTRRMIAAGEIEIGDMR